MTSLTLWKMPLPCWISNAKWSGKLLTLAAAALSPQHSVWLTLSIVKFRARYQKIRINPELKVWIYERSFLILYTKPYEVLYQDRKSTRLNSSHVKISYAVFCLKKKKK